MPEYKKKKVRRISKRRPERISEAKRSSAVSADISMTSKKTVKARGNEPQQKQIRVIKGKKLARQRFLKAIAAIAVISAVAISVLHFTLPVGIIECVGNITATVGSGTYPSELYGTETLTTEQRGNYYYVLTDTDFCAYSNGGKKIISVAHGFAHPVLETSQTRALIFDQSGSEFQIYNLKKRIDTQKTEQPILTAAISRCGAYAVATRSDKYASEVSVYDKDGKRLYQWYSAADMVNGAVISPDGKQLVVSTVSASGGVLKSRLSVFRYASADPVFTVDFSGTAVYSLEGLSGGFVAVTSEGCSFFSWKEHTRKDFRNDYAPTVLKRSQDGLVMVFSRTSDKSDNRILVLSPKGEQTASFNFSGTVSDIVFSDNHIYCISDTTVHMLDKNGEHIASAECGFGSVRLATVGNRSVAVMTNGDITKITFS